MKGICFIKGLGFKVGVRIGFRLELVSGLVEMVMVQARGWLLHDAYEGPYKDRNKKMCMWEREKSVEMAEKGKRAEYRRVWTCRRCSCMSMT